MKIILNGKNYILSCRPWWISHAYIIDSGEVIVARVDVEGGMRDLTEQELDLLRKSEGYNDLPESMYCPCVDRQKRPKTNNLQQPRTLQQVKEFMAKLENEFYID